MRIQFGIYRDGDNNLDGSQAVTLKQAVAVSAADADVRFSVEDTTARTTGDLRTYDYSIAGGHVAGATERPGQNMAAQETLARFVARTLDDAQRSGAAQSWLELSDHGAGDGGGLEADSAHALMREPTIGAAIAQGIAIHAKAHPEDAGRTIDGVVANQCLMASLGFADTLSRAGVRYLAASPETMISPGVPSSVARDIAENQDATGQARAIVGDVMRYTYGAGGQTWHPAAAFDVLDLDPHKVRDAENAVKTLNDSIIASAGAGATEREALRNDAATVAGMVRFNEATPDMPWHADRPALALYRAFAGDARLDPAVRSAAQSAADAVGDLVIAHAESAHFGPFDGSNYRDAAGPTVHFPINAAQIDPWAPAVSETHNAFYDAVDGLAAARAITA